MLSDAMQRLCDSILFSVDLHVKSGEHSGQGAQPRQPLRDVVQAECGRVGRETDVIQDPEGLALQSNLRLTGASAICANCRHVHEWSCFSPIHRTNCECSQFVFSFLKLSGES